MTLLPIIMMTQCLVEDARITHNVEQRRKWFWDPARLKSIVYIHSVPIVPSWQTPCVLCRSKVELTLSYNYL